MNFILADWQASGGPFVWKSLKKNNIQFSFYVFSTKFQCTSHQFKLNNLGNFLITLFGGSRKLQIHKNYVFFLFLQIISMLLYQTWIVAPQGLPNNEKMRPLCLWGSKIYTLKKLRLWSFMQHTSHLLTTVLAKL